MNLYTLASDSAESRYVSSPTLAENKPHRGGVLIETWAVLGLLIASYSRRIDRYHLKCLDVRCGLFPSLFNHVVTYTLAIAQCRKTCALNSADVHKNIIRAVLRLNKTKPLGGVEPFNSTYSHSGLHISLRAQIGRVSNNLDILGVF